MQHTTGPAAIWKKLGATLAEFEACDPDHTQEEADLDNRFHLLVTKATGNPIVQITMEPIYSLLPRMRNYIYGNIEGEKSRTLGAHRELLDALRRQDGPRAYKNHEKAPGTNARSLSYVHETGIRE